MKKRPLPKNSKKGGAGMKKRLLLILLVVGLIGLLGIKGLAEERLRFKIFYQSEQLASLSGFSAKDHNSLMYAEFADYLGEWAWFSYHTNNNYYYLGTHSKLDFGPGDAVSLHQMRNVSIERVGKYFGFEVEARIWKGIWVGAVYNQTPVFVIKTTEQDKKMVFEEFKQTYYYKSEFFDYYEYDIGFSRLNVVRETSEKLSNRNLQLYTKVEVEQGFFQMFGGLGLDFFNSRRKVEKKEEVSNLMLWTEKIIVESGEPKIKILEPVQNSDSKWLVRPFILMGAQIEIVKGLYFGVQTKFFSKEKKIEHNKDFLLPITKNCPKNWTIMPSERSINIFISFGF